MVSRQKITGTINYEWPLGAKNVQDLSSKVRRLRCHLRRLRCHLTRPRCHLRRVRCHLTRLKWRYYLTRLRCHLTRLRCHLIRPRCHLTRLRCHLRHPRFEWRQTLFDVQDLSCRAGRYRDRALMPGNGFSLNISTTVSRDTAQPYKPSITSRSVYDVIQS